MDGRRRGDIYCFQEIKASITDIDIAVFEAKGYRVYWYSAEKKGYSGWQFFVKIWMQKT